MLTFLAQEKSSARVTVSEMIAGNPERILNVSGALDAVAKVGPGSRYSMLTFSGIRPYRPSYQRRAFRRCIRSRLEGRHHQIHHSQFQDG